MSWYPSPFGFSHGFRNARSLFIRYGSATISAGIAKTAGASTAANFFVLSPPTYNITSITAPKHTVIDIFGSKIIKIHEKTPKNRIFSNVFVLFTLSSAQTAAANITKPNFAYSDGCIVKNPRFIHRFAPKLSTPSFGTNTRASKIRLEIITGYFAFFSFSTSNIRTANIKNSPIANAIACFLT